MRGEIPKASQLLETYSVWYPDRPLVMGYLSQLYARLNKPEQAQAMSDRYHAMTGRPWEPIHE